MKNMKKALCFILAMIFVLGLCTIGAGAANFSDSSKVTYKNAVNVMGSLGIIKGDDNDGDGKMEFRPKDTITRAEAAVIIARMILGVNYEKLPKAGTSFSDVGPGMSEWAQPAIAFCEARGIVNGRGDGKFYPQDNVTGLEMAKMLLCANGYGSDGKFTGKGWNINVFTEATTNKVFKSVADSVDFEAPATREQCALYTLNTLQNVKQLEVGSDGKLIEKSTMGEQVWNMKSKQGQIRANEETGADYLELVVKEKDENDVLQDVVYKFDYDYAGLDPLTLVAHEAKVFYNDEGEPLKDSNGNNYYSAYEVEDLSRVASLGYTLSSAYTALVGANKANADKVISEIPVWQNYAYTSTPDSSNVPLSSYTKISDIEGRNLFGVPSGKFVLGEDGKILAYMVDYFETAGIVTSVSSSGVKITTSAMTGFDASFKPIYGLTPETTAYTDYYDGIKVDDIVVVQKIGDRKVLKPTTITEPITITQYTDADGFTSYTASYENGKYTGSRAYAPTLIAEKSSKPKYKVHDAVRVDDVVRLYLDPNGAYISIEVVESGTDAGVYFINKTYTTGVDDEYGNPDTTTYLQCVNAEGEEVSIPTVSSGFSGFSGRGAYTITMNSKGTAAESVKATDIASFTKGGVTSYLTNPANNRGDYYISSDTKVYFVKEDKTVTDPTSADYGKTKALTVKSGALPSSAISTTGQIFAAYTQNSGTGYSVNTIWLYQVDEEPKASNSIIFLASASVKGHDADGDYYTVYIDGVSTEKVHINTKASDKLVKGQFYTFTVDKDGFYTLSDYNTRVVVNRAFTAGEIANGKLYYKADGKDISGVKIVDYNAYVYQTPDKTDYILVNSVADVEKLLNLIATDPAYATYKVTLCYRYNSNGVPTDNIYVFTSDK